MRSYNLRSLLFPVTLFTLSLTGLAAAFALTVEKINSLANPGAPAACDINPLVQCGANLASWQGALFGFPNPLLGLIGWPVVATVAVLLAAGVSLPAWFMRVFSIGVSGAFGFVLWLMYVSFFQLGTLCPWCMVTWVSTVPVFVSTWGYVLREGIWSDSPTVRRIGEHISSWTFTTVIVFFALAAAVAEIQLSWVRAIF